MIMTGKRHLRKEIKPYLILLLILFIALIAVIIGPLSSNDGAKRYQKGNCTIFYPKNSAFGKEKAVEYCADKKDVTYDYTSIEYGDYLLIKYNDFSYFVNKNGKDIEWNIDKEKVRDYLIYNSKKDNKDFTNTADLYNDEVLNYEVVGFKEENILLYFIDYDYTSAMPLQVLQESMNFGLEKKEYIKPHYISENKKVVCLTFDDGPGLNDEELLAILKKYDAHATFFVVGRNINDNNIELIKESIAQGNEYGSHTYSHARLDKLESDAQLEEIMQPVKTLKEKIDYKVTLFRPPYGIYDQDVLNESGLQLVLWNVDTLDWKNKDSNSVFQEVKSDVYDGAVILMHNIVETNNESLEMILPYLIEEGYQFLTISEYLAISNK